MFTKILFVFSFKFEFNLFALFERLNFVLIIFKEQYDFLTTIDPFTVQTKQATLFVTAMQQSRVVEVSHE